MSRYVDAEHLREEIGRWAEHTEYYNESELNIMRCVIDQIDSAPSIDIVRCGECKKAHLTADGTCKYCEEWKDNNGNYIEVYHNADDFCSYGEREGE